MTYSPDSLLADLFRLYRDAKPQQERGEAFLEHALAAALCEAGVWSHVAAHAGFDAPIDDPRVTTQDGVEDGRTDISLHWSGRPGIVLELKRNGPPTPDQVQRYIDAGKHVVVVARLPARYGRGFDESRGRYLGCVTWGQLRALDWQQSPRPWRQFLSLVDEMGAAMNRVSLAQLTSVLTSWPAWDILEQWSVLAAESAAEAISDSKLTWVTKETKKTKTFYGWQYYARWLWAKPWRGNGISPTALCGFFVGRPPQSPVLVEGAPDVVLLLRANPEGDVARKLKSDPSYVAARDRWLADSTAEVFREADPADSKWGILRVRSSSLILLQASNPDAALADWAVARVGELVDSGVMDALGAVELALRGSSSAPPVPPAVDEEDDETPDGRS